MFYTNKKLSESMNSKRVCATRFAHVAGTFNVPHYMLLPITEPMAYTDKNGKNHVVMIAKDSVKAFKQRKMIHKLDENIKLIDKVENFISKELISFIDGDNYFSHLSILSVIMNIIPDVNEMELISYFYYYIMQTKAAYGTIDSVM